MSEPNQPHAERPVLNGLVALLAVGLGVGLILALVALVGANMLGLDGDEGGSAAADSTVRDSMSIPSQFEVTTDGGPLITLATEDTDEPTETATETESQPSETTETPSAKPGQISLQAEQNSVRAGDRIYFAGVYPDGEGAILWVQRWENGGWADFPASVGVTNGTFRSYVFTEISGLNRFRVIDRDTGKASNEIRVRVG